VWMKPGSSPGKVSLTPTVHVCIGKFLVFGSHHQSVRLHVLGLTSEYPNAELLMTRNKNPPESDTEDWKLKQNTRNKLKIPNAEQRLNQDSKK